MMAEESPCPPFSAPQKEDCPASPGESYFGGVARAEKAPCSNYRLSGCVRCTLVGCSVPWVALKWVERISKQVRKETEGDVEQATKTTARAEMTTTARLKALEPMSQSHQSSRYNLMWFQACMEGDAQEIVHS